MPQKVRPGSLGYYGVTSSQVRECNTDVSKCCLLQPGCCQLSFSGLLTGEHPQVTGNAEGHRGISRPQYSEWRVSHKEASNMNLKVTKSLGMLLLGIWLIVTGLLTVLSVVNPIVHVLLALLAIAAGVFIVLGR